MPQPVLIMLLGIGLIGAFIISGRQKKPSDQNEILSFTIHNKKWEGVTVKRYEEQVNASQKEQRIGIERRQYNYYHFIPERRSGKDRRSFRRPDDHPFSTVTYIQNVDTPRIDYQFRGNTMAKTWTVWKPQVLTPLMEPAHPLSNTHY